MSIAESMLPEYDHELATTRRVLERVPEAEFGWKPHEKSMSLGELAAHIAHVPFWLNAVMDMPFYDLRSDDPDVTRSVPATREALLADFDSKTKKARASLVKATDAEMTGQWTFKKEGHEVFSLPRIAAVRSFVMNHLIHHRGQLSVYLRLKGVPVPAIYGPSADEQ